MQVKLIAALILSGAVVAGTAALRAQHQGMVMPEPAKQATSSAQTPPPGGGMPGMNTGACPMCSMMLSMAQKNDAEIDQLVAKMNSATGSAKIDATAAVVAKLVQERKQMHDHMKQMMGGQMPMGQMRPGMMNCPMMSGTPGRQPGN